MVILALVVGAGAVEAQTMGLLGVTADGTTQTGVPADPIDPEIADLVALARRMRNAQTEWTASRPLSDGINAHSTNTIQHMKEALEDDYNWLEGDIRQEINAPHAMEARHDKGQEDGDNLLLRQWLTIGAASGRGLKLDVKEDQHTARILDEVRASGVPDERLMFNLAFNAMAQWGARIRAQHPRAWLAINPPDGDGKLDRARAEAMVAQGRQFGGPVTFVVRFDLLTKETLAILKTGGPVSVWNALTEGTIVRNADALTRSLKEQGVNGVVDIRDTNSLKLRVARKLLGVKNALGF